MMQPQRPISCPCPSSVHTPMQGLLRALICLLVFAWTSWQAPQLSAGEARGRHDADRAAWRLGSNLLYDVATVANLSLEADFRRHYAWNTVATFSPWNITPTLAVRTCLVQTELRAYFAEGFQRHHLGLELHGGYYNVAFGGRTRYQDRDCNTPLLGAGLCYGYLFVLSPHWSLDCDLGAGYTHLAYDCFYNVANGAKITTRSARVWGVTKAGITLSYQF